MKKILFGSAIALVTGSALAATSLIGSWTAPTLNTNGSKITGTITYNLYFGPQGNETFSQVGLKGTTAVIPASPGVQTCGMVTAVVNGVESARSAEVCATPPGSSTSTPSTPTAFAMR